MEMESKLVDFHSTNLQHASNCQTEWSRYAASRQACGIAKEAITDRQDQYRLTLDKNLKPTCDVTCNNSEIFCLVCCAKARVAQHFL